MKCKIIDKIDYTSIVIIKYEKDILKNIDNIKTLQKTAYNFLLNGNKNFKIIEDFLNGKRIIFTRISAKEYVYGKQARILSQSDTNKEGFYKLKMRIVPSIDELILYSKIFYYSPLKHSNSLFLNGFNNYQGLIMVDDYLFQYIVRIGVTKEDNIFYDINLRFLEKIKEAEQTVPSIYTRH